MDPKHFIQYNILVTEFEVKIKDSIFEIEV